MRHRAIQFVPSIALVVPLLVVAVSLPAGADVRYQSETQVKFSGTLGTMMKLVGGSKPVTTTVSLKGNTLRTDGKETSEIIDLDKRVFIDVDHKKKQYTVLTFDAMLEGMRKALAEAHGEVKAAEQEASQPNPQVKFAASLQKTGKTQTLDGHATESVLLTLTVEGQDSTGAKGTLNTASEMWMAKDLRGYDELQAFYKRLADQLGREWSGNAKLWETLAASNPEMATAMRQLQDEARKVEGTPLLTTTTVDAVGAPPPASASATAPQAEAEPKDEGVKLEKPDVGKMLGRFGKKKVDEHQKAKESEKAAQGGRSNLMTSTTRYTGFSTEALAGSVFELPAGYKQVEPKE